MQHRILPKLCRTHILLGEIYPKLIELKDSEEHGPRGSLELVYRGIMIKFVGELPEPLIVKQDCQWENPNRFNDGFDHDEL